MQKVKLKKQYLFLKPLNIILIIFFLVILTAIFLLKYLSNQVSPVMFEYAKTEAKKNLQHCH